MGVGGQRSVQAVLLPGKSPSTHCRGGWLGHRAGLEGHGEKKIFAPTGVRTPDRPTSSWSLCRPRYLGYLAITLAYLVFIRWPQFIDKASDCNDFTKAKVRRFHNLYLILY